MYGHACCVLTAMIKIFNNLNPVREKPQQTSTCQHYDSFLDFFDSGFIFFFRCSYIRCINRYIPKTKTTTSHTHARLTALCLGLPGWASTRKIKPIWILLKQETVSASGISWAICKSAPHSRQITTPAPHHSVFTGRMSFLAPNQQCQSTEGTKNNNIK